MSSRRALMNFYLSKNNQKLGPYSVEQLRVFLQQGLVGTEDQVWAEGWTSWMAIGNVPGLAVQAVPAETTHMAGAGTPAMPNNPPQYSNTSAGILVEGKNPVLACVLSLVIVGVGQFYNGDWPKGWVLLVTCILASVYSLGTLWLIWALFSAIDAYRVAAKQKPLGQYFPI